ncbi:winged helix-turn-helix transcriptional regulator [Actinomadura barringtoniae]|uniref:Winged helix-turn-helix transcriptional regulator n=1 Tax=Actinomadura barringtoniae TaxID=1427535 RepID=A0A939TBS9_9ACTN|nr:helix-turn-helix domain-containing protein [Actinomadura barringtoniae]MBO2450505.1 winged helix-turn-helix transcriptional regulator [Actinomadura barringtoniae]
MTERPERREISDPETLRLLAHPLRYKIARELRQGPATATTLARKLGLNTGATSYHLRQMAEHGFIEEASELGKGRERWWRTRARDVRFPPRSRQTDEARALLEEIKRLDLADTMERLARYQLVRDEMGEWGDAELFSQSSILVTFEEARQFFEEYIALLYRYKRPAGQTPAGARVMLARLVMFPEVTDEEERPPEEK